MPATPDHHPSNPLAATVDHGSTGHPMAIEPHPWGAPLPAGHPGYQPPGRLDIGAFARWFVYATVLAITTIVITLVAVVAAENTLGTTNEAPAPVTMPLGHTTATASTPTGTDDESSGQALTSNERDRFVQTNNTSRYHGPAHALTQAAGAEQCGEAGR